MEDIFLDKMARAISEQFKDHVGDSQATDLCVPLLKRERAVVVMMIIHVEWALNCCSSLWIGTTGKECSSKPTTRTMAQRNPYRVLHVQCVR